MKDFRFGFNPREITVDELIPEISKFKRNLLNETKREELQLKILALMEGYMIHFAKSFARKSKKTTFEDYMSEMVVCILDKITTLNLDENSTGRMITSYLYYWLNDCCQRHYTAMECATSLSLSKAKKIAKSENKLNLGLISRVHSLNATIKHNDDDVAEFTEIFGASGSISNPYISIYKDEIKKLILKEFGEEVLNIFIKLYVNGRIGTKRERQKITPLISKIRGDEGLIDMIKELIDSGEGLL